MDGLSNAALMQKPEWVAGDGWSGQTGRDGSAQGAASTQGSGGRVKTALFPSAAATCFFGVAINAGVQGVVNGATVHLGFVRSLAIEPCINLNASGFWDLRLNSGAGTVLATSSGHAPVNTGEWHHYQFKVICHPSAGTFLMKMDGVTVINYTGQTALSVAGSVEGVRVQVSGTTGNTYDDMWACDAVDATATQGRPNNDFLGDLRIAALIPTGDGASVQWTPSTGTTHATLVDEVPPNTTDFVSSNVAGQRDLYNVTDLSGSVVSVYGLRVGHYSQKTDAGARSVNPLVREPDATVTVQATQALTTTYLPYWAPTLYLKPHAGGVFTPSDVNATQVGVELV